MTWRHKTAWRRGALLAGYLIAISSAQGAFSVSDPSLSWVAIPFPDGTVADYDGDLGNNGHPYLDIVGSAYENHQADHPGFYTSYFDAGTASMSDDYLAFRVRLAGIQNNPKGYIFVGIDGNQDQRIDLIAGSTIGTKDGNSNGIWAADTTSGKVQIGQQLRPFAHNASNYSLTVADSELGGEQNWFLSFAIPFQSIVDELALSEFSAQQHVLYSVFSYSDSGSSSPTDVVGFSGTDLTLADWGSTSSLPITAEGAMPEPGLVMMLGAGIASLCSVRPRRTTRTDSPVA